MSAYTSLWICLLLWATPADAAFRDLGAGARAPGMANAFTAVANDAFAAHYNPAGLALLEQPQASLSYSRLHLGLTDGSDLSVSDIIYAHPSKHLAGTLALSWQRFSLASLYHESAYGLSYARRAIETPWGRLYAGGRFKIYGLSFTRNDDAVNAKDADLNVVGPDPTLMGRNLRHLPDLDLGLLFRARGRLSYGFTLQHLLEPNIAFSPSENDPLTLAYRFGVGYKSLWLNLASTIKLERAPDGKPYKEISFGGERYFPTLSFGQFGLRAGLAVGSHEFRQLTAGLAYRINKLQFDYAFLIPLSGIPDTAGTHRLGLTFHFGAPTLEDAYRDTVARLIREGPQVEGYAYEFEDIKRKKPMPQVTLSTASALIDAGQYEKAYEEVSHILRTRATKVEVVALARRLEALTTFYPTLGPSAGPVRGLLAQAIQEYLTGQDYAAVLRTSYALSLSPTPQLSHWLTRLSEITEAKPHRVPVGTFLSLLDLKLRDSQTLFLSNRPREAEALLRDVLILKPRHPTALTRLGSILYAKGRYRGSIAVWKKALSASSESSETRDIRHMIRQAKRRLSARNQKSVHKTEEAQPEKKEADPRLLEKLYQRGVELYIGGQKAQAAKLYQAMLRLDPDNKQARKALNRLEKEKMLQPGRPQ